MPRARQATARQHLAASAQLCVTHPCTLLARVSHFQASPAPAVGAKVVPAVISVAVGLAVRFLVPCPAGVTLQVCAPLPPADTHTHTHTRMS